MIKSELVSRKQTTKVVLKFIFGIFSTPTSLYYFLLISKLGIKLELNFEHLVDKLTICGAIFGPLFPTIVRLI